MRKKPKLKWEPFILDLERARYKCCSILRGTSGASFALGGAVYEVMDCDGEISHFMHIDDVMRFITIEGVCNNA